MTFSQIRQYIKGVLSNIFNKTLSNIAPKFNPIETYSIGDRVIYKGDLYRFTSAHTGAWATADVSKTNVNAYLNNNSMVACGGGYAPIGTVIAYMGTRAPSDFLICDGTIYNISDYTELADFFEAQFGSSNFFGGDGNTTFAVPDLRGEFLRGTGTNSHTNQGSGANVGVHQNGTEHPFLIYGTGASQLLTFKRNNNTVPLLNWDRIVSDSTQIQIATSTAYGEYTNQNSRYTSRPTNTSVLYCIKAKSQGNGYSLDEQIVGTWIDGKPIYQKTFTFANPVTVPNNSWYSSGISIENCERIISCKTHNLTGVFNAECVYENSQIYIETTRNDGAVTIYSFTIQYTKTTDTAS